MGLVKNFYLLKYLHMLMQLNNSRERRQKLRKRRRDYRQLDEFVSEVPVDCSQAVNRVATG